ncbi:hypothetical protein [Deinococcus sonorensis]|uniref:Transposase n=2 Tax=Deinococcus sonorensis TaxID=309891 RepID=A0AAU7UEG2_9DEIO
MITFRKSNALEPEKERSVQIDLVPLLLFGLGFLLTRTLISTWKAEPA